MAENKKAFMLYADLINTVSLLDKKKAGELFMTILQYINDQNPVIKDHSVKLVFEPIKQQLKRDLKKWEKRAERAKENGKQGGRPKTESNPENPVGYSGLQENTLKPSESVTVTDTVTVNVTDTVKVIKKVRTAPDEVYRKFAHLFLTIPDYEKLIKEGWSKEQVDEILDRIENYKDNKKYNSLLLTARNWLRSDEKKKPPEGQNLPAIDSKFLKAINVSKQQDDEINAKYGTK